MRGLADFNTRQSSFEAIDFGTKMTVEAFFKRSSSILTQTFLLLEYGITLKYPHLPLINVGQKTIYLPPETCEIVPNQPCRGKLVNQTSRMRGKSPKENASAIVGLGLDKLGYREGADLLSAFRISVGAEMSVVS